MKNSKISIKQMKNIVIVLFSNAITWVHGFKFSFFEHIAAIELGYSSEK